MKKMIVPVVIGLVVGLGGSMAARMILAKEPATLEQSLDEALGAETADSVVAHADSVAGLPADTIAPDVQDSLGVAVAVAETTHVTGHTAAALARSAAVNAASEAASEGSSVTPAIADSALPDGALTSAELAKLFASMQARDAAKVLEQMEDYEIQVILGALGNREAAAILSNLSPERAAVISRAVIRGERSVR